MTIHRFPGVYDEDIENDEEPHDLLALIVLMRLHARLADEARDRETALAHTRKAVGYGTRALFAPEARR